MKQARIQIGTTVAGAPLWIPLDIATESVAIIARKGAGKTYTGRVLAEDLLDHHVQVVVIDPLDVWWGLRLAADGGAGGCNVVIFGGSHADLPLTETAGKALADVIVDRGISAVMVLDDLSLAAQRRFMADFGERLFERKSKAEHRTPLHVIIDEADAFAPQRVPPEGTRCAGVIDRMVRRGRSRGLGTTAISQRPAVLAKDVLTQTEVLIALQVTGPQDRDALSEWVKANADAAQAKEFFSSLASMDRGQAWIWSPSRLKVFERIQVRKTRTYDSSYTPKVGESRPAAPRLRAVELDTLREQLATTLKEAAASDPALLRKRIAALEHELAAAKAAPAPANEQQLAKAYGCGLEEGVSRGRGSLTELAMAVDAAVASLARGRSAVAPLLVESSVRPVAHAPAAAPRQVAVASATTAASRSVAVLRVNTSAPAQRANFSRPPGDALLSKAARLVLTALAQYPQGRTKVQVALLTGYAHTGGGFNNALSSLRTAGCISVGDRLVISSEGIAALGSFDPLPTGRALLDHWRAQLSKAERAVVDVLAEAWPKALSKEAVAAAAGYEANGGGFNNALSRLRTLELIAGRGEMKLSDDLMRGP